jgi:hypothetical protein
MLARVLLGVALSGCTVLPPQASLVQPETYCRAAWVGFDRLVTAAHCLPDAQPGEVVSLSGFGARVLYADTGADVLVLRTSIPPVPHGALEVVDGEIGEPVSVAGRHAHLIAVDLVDVDVRRGESGTPAVGARGLVGIVVRRAEGGTRIAPSAAIRAALAAADAVRLPIVTPSLSWEDP